MKKIIAAVLLANCASTFAASGWSQTGKIVEVYNLGWTVMVKLEGAPIDYSGGGACSNTYYYAMNSDAPNYNQLLSQILMAHASGLRAGMWIDGSQCAGQSANYQKIKTIRTFP